MRATTCPKCQARVSPTDDTCMDCGADLIDARQDIVEQAKQNARSSTGPASPAAAVANPAAAGLVVPGENADEKRLRVFDKQEADKLRAQRPAQVVLIIIALAAAGAMAAVASGYLKKAGGMPAIKTLSVAEFKALGLNVFSDERIMFIVTAGLALAGLLCVIGEVKRLLGTNSAIAYVAAGETPNVVHISAFTQMGLIIGSFFAPPLGLIMGILFKFSKDQDTRAIGSLMIYASLLSIAIIVVNWIWSLASQSLQQNRPAPKAEANDTACLLRLLA